MIENQEVEAAQAAQREVRKRLGRFCNQHEALGEGKRFHVELVMASEHSMPERFGQRPGAEVVGITLTSSFILGEAELPMQTCDRAKLSTDLKSWFPTCWETTILGSMHEFLHELQEKRGGVASYFIEKARAVGEEAFRSDLADDAEFWAQCEIAGDWAPDTGMTSRTW